MGIIVRGLPGLLVLCGLSWGQGAECTLRLAPEDHVSAQARALGDRFRRISAIPAPRLGGPSQVDAAEMPRRNFIDDAIFGKLQQAGVASARLSTDEEFLRRVSFDLTGHPPSVAQVREFVADQNPEKRYIAIERLLSSSQFNDRWTMWFGDLFQNLAFPSNFDRQIKGRNAFYEWILKKVSDRATLREMALEAIPAAGNSYRREEGAVNFAMNGIAAMGPVQDTYDLSVVRSQSVFLGLSHYDCLLCHDGRRHLDLLSIWGTRMTRVEAQKMAAFFSKTVFRRNRTVPSTDPAYDSYDVSDAAAGAYNLNTNFGNRTDRVPVGSLRSLAPEYRDGKKPDDGNWRIAYAAFVVEDPLFALNFANRLWKEMFGVALIDPVDALDPDRLDPANPPPAPWTLQASHPELLVKLADALRERNFDLREFLRLLVESNAYQLSSRYDGEWRPDYVPLFARKYPRRLEGEEIHDALNIATGTYVTYTITGLSPVQWAMQLPDPQEPRSNGAAVGFMQPFYRGNRDSFFRIPDGSIQQQLNLMNDTFVTNRVKVAASPSLAAVAKLADNAAAVEELFLLFLQRKPDEREMGVAVRYLENAGPQRSAYIEDLAWALANKVDLLYNY